MKHFSFNPSVDFDCSQSKMHNLKRKSGFVHLSSAHLSNLISRHTPASSLFSSHPGLLWFLYKSRHFLPQGLCTCSCPDISLLFWSLPSQLILNITSICFLEPPSLEVTLPIVLYCIRGVIRFTALIPVAEKLHAGKKRDPSVEHVLGARCFAKS